MTAGAVATPHVAASEAGGAALRAGGTAVDAAVAAAAVLAVVYPHNCGVGGDLFALISEPGGAVRSINSSGPAARGVDAAALRALGDEMPIVGVHAITVPGAVGGWERLHRIGGGLEWSEVLAGAVALAQDGAPVVPGLAAAISGLGGLESDPGMAAIFAPDGRRLRSGEMLVQPQLAATLRSIAAEGAGALYGGGVGAALVTGLRRRGSALAVEDLAAFEPETTGPLAAGFRGCEVLTSPPNSSGVLLAQALLALEASGAADPLGADAGALGAIFAAGNHQRERLLGDPDAHPFDREAWLGTPRIDEIVAGAWGGWSSAQGGRLAGPGGGLSRREAGPGSRPTGDTIGLVAVDADGRAVSLIQSLFFGFGARILEPVTGILLHNRGSSFSLDPDHPNALAPGRRPAHTLMPVMVRRDGAVIGVLGTMGGQVHAQIHTQLLLRLLGGMDPETVAGSPRFAVWPVGEDARGEARVEANCDPAVLAALAAAGLDPVTVAPFNSLLGHAQVLWNAGRWRGASDPRADGSVVYVT